jgi:two-component system phosphate regulon sensor histidine kinase PhoR
LKIEMTTFLFVVLALVILIAAWFAWLYLRLKRRLGDYSHIVRDTSEGKVSPLALPVDVQGLEELSNAVKGLAATTNFQLSTVDAERAKLAAVLDTMTDGVLIADAEGRIQFANPASERLLENKNALGRSVTEIVRHHQLVEAWRKCRATGEAQEETIELSARRQFLRLLVIPDKYTGGSLLLVQDLTRLRRLETMRRDFVSNLSHELRTPLASLKALTETLNEGALEDPPAARRFLSRIETEVDALTQMVQELLELTRIESGQVALELQPVAPEELLQTTAERMRLQAERAGLALRLECPRGLPKVRADASRLEQVLVNLIHNAVKFTRPGGEVVLSAQAEGDFVRFAVRDSGVGIPEEDLPRIFERFYRVDRSRSGSGTGLGLSIARHIVEAHGGRIWAESLEGQGSTFYFTIPVNRE